MDTLVRATARAEERHFWFRGLRRTAPRLLGRALGNPRSRLLVDCGAGTGRNLDWLADFGPAVGVELTPAGTSWARRHGRTVVRGSVVHLPFDDAVADVVTSFDVLYCLPDDDERRAVAEMFRVLRPGGVALVNVAALDILRGRHSAFVSEVRRYTPARLRGLLENAGFRMERMTFTNCTTFPVTLAVRLADRWLGRDTVASDAELRIPSAPVNAAFDVLLRVEGVALRWIDLPVGSSLLAIARKPADATRRAG